MRRSSWFEVHDHHLFPRFLRHLVTDALEAMWNATDMYRPIMPRLKRVMEEADTREVVDLCSGGGGPWFRLQPALASAGCPVSVRLTDKYPNQTAFDKASRQSHQAITGYPEPVDANCVPHGLTGFRTMFSSFHHFDPEDARAILTDSFGRREGIAIFEAAERSAPSICAIFFVPMLTLVLAPRIRPFRWSRLWWTYLLPIIPFVLWIDGILSCLRSYSQADMAELIVGLDSESYSWQVGQDGEGILRITYLIGSPAGAVPRVYESEIAAEDILDDSGLSFHNRPSSPLGTHTCAKPTSEPEIRLAGGNCMPTRQRHRPIPANHVDEESAS